MNKQSLGVFVNMVMKDFFTQLDQFYDRLVYEQSDLETQKTDASRRLSLAIAAGVSITFKVNAIKSPASVAATGLITINTYTNTMC